MSETRELLTSHRLVSTRWRVIRPEGAGAWHARPVRHDDDCDEECPCGTFARFGDALRWADQEGAP